MSSKVYCKNCKYIKTIVNRDVNGIGNHSYTHLCMASKPRIMDSFFEQSEYHSACFNLNEKNNCTNYKKSGIIDEIKRFFK